MSKRVYKHQCKDCDTRFYIVDLKLVSASTCPKCNGDCIYVDEYKIEQVNKYNQDSFDAFVRAIQRGGIDFASSKDRKNPGIDINERRVKDHAT